MVKKSVFLMSVVRDLRQRRAHTAVEGPGGHSVGQAAGKVGGMDEVGLRDWVGCRCGGDRIGTGVRSWMALNVCSRMFFFFFTVHGKM